jgi:prenyltransferase beta subunit
MSLYTNKAVLSLVHMTKEMFRKNIEPGRIVKTSALLTLSGVSPNCIDENIIKSCVEGQFDDGGYAGNTDTIWSICLLQQYPLYTRQTNAAREWLKSNSDENGGFGRTKRDMPRIPVTGLALYLLPQLAQEKHLKWLETAWTSEINSLTYKAAYTLMAFNKNNYTPHDKTLIDSTIDWLVSQQEDNGGFAPWLKHPAGPNIYCTAIATLGLLSYGIMRHSGQIHKAYRYMQNTQLPGGIWPYHEIEDGASWGLYAMSKVEEIFGE